MMSTSALKTTIKRVDGDSITPIIIFNRLRGVHKFFFEGQQVGEKERFTYIGVNPVKSYTGTDETVIEYDYYTNESFVYKGELFEILKKVIPPQTNETQFEFSGGMIGFISYNAIVPQSKANECEINLPHMQFSLYDTVIVYDHYKEEVIFIHNDLTGIDAHERFTILEKQIFTAVDEEPHSYELSSFYSEMSDAQYGDLVRQAQRFIEEDEVKQLVVSRRFTADFTGNAFSLYRELRKSTKAPNMYFLEYDGYCIIGASPKEYLRIDGDNIAVTPVTGARPRGSNAREDIQMELTLLQNAKEINSHNLLVDMTTKDLSEICVPTAIALDEYMKPMQFMHSIRLVTEIKGKLQTETHPVDALRKLVPPAASSGVPKERASEIIQEIEVVPRAFYGGVIGRFSLNKKVNFSLLQQTMVIKEQKAYTQAGANILADTIDIDAIVETRNKIEAFLLLDSN